MKSPRNKPPKARTIPAPTKRPAALRDPLRLSTQGEEIVVWVAGTGTRPRKIGAVNRLLADDARRHGQDLVGDLVDTALREVDRQKPRSSRQ